MTNRNTPSVKDPTVALVDRIDPPLYVVTVRSKAGCVSGCLAGFVTQSSISPPRFLVCVSKAYHTSVVAETSQCMALHLLGVEQLALASLFGGQTGDSVDKFSRCSWRPGTTGAPVLAECAAWVEGTIMGRFGAGDHDAYLLRPEGGGSGTCEGILSSHDVVDLEPGHPA